MRTLSPILKDSRRQNAHLTFKHNLHQGRHGWLRLTPAYSVRLVEAILGQANPNARVLDPFSGTGTAPLCAGYMGHAAVGLELNPFLVWFSSIKCMEFGPEVIRNARDAGAAVAALARSSESPRVAAPPIHNIARWWNAADLDFICRLKAAVTRLVEASSKEQDLLMIAFCRTVIALSNAAFNHQSMSFGKKNLFGRLFDLRRDSSTAFQNELAFVLESAGDAPTVLPEIIQGDARQSSHYAQGKYDIVITSPPYPNRISYIRELRPYMYWLEFLRDGRAAGELDWQAIGGTWGIATSRLADWRPSRDAFVPGALKTAVEAISRPANPNGTLLANYVAKYFEDMWCHIADLRNMLKDGAAVHYIVGNSTFYSTLLPVEEIYKDMLEHAGFRDVRIARIRKRNSKAELFEYDVQGEMSPIGGSSSVSEKLAPYGKPLRKRRRKTRA